MPASNEPIFESTHGRAAWRPAEIAISSAPSDIDDVTNWYRKALREVDLAFNPAA